LRGTLTRRALLPAADLSLPPTFSTWAHVAMLHMYLLVVRFRCFDADRQQAWQGAMVNHFFYEAEAKMDVVHAVTSRAIRQRYLKDFFVQWRGLILAYDEGLVKGDAVLAEAVWRNLFKAREDVDVRALAAVVSWIRAGIQQFGEMTDEAVEAAWERGFPTIKAQLRMVDAPTPSLRPAFQQAGILSS
jgi:cytochrome b pre-mRNA-processing protein 3